MLRLRTPLAAVSLLLLVPLATALAVRSTASPVDPRDGTAAVGSTTPLLAAGRPFTLHLPPQAGTRLPLLIVVPGFAVPPERLDDELGISEHADAHGYAVAWAEGRDRSFNARVCCDPARAQGVDDERYLADIRRALVDIGVADPRRVYLLGHSNGDMLTLMAACHRPDLFAAQAGSGGDFPYATPQDCAGARVLHLHGRHDLTVPVSGGWHERLKMRTQPIATLPARMRGADVTLRLLDCGHGFPTRHNDCALDGLGTAWSFFSRT